MNRESTSHNETWDFYGHRGVGTTSNFYSQRDWNQTLITKINMVASRIHHSSLRGGGDTIELHPKMLFILESLEFYNIVEKKLAGRFDVIVNNTIEENVIFVYYKHGLDEIENARIGPNGIPFFLIPLVNGQVRGPLRKLNKKTFIKKKKVTPPPITRTFESPIPTNASEMSTIELTTSANLSEDQIMEYKRGLVGYIEVQNYIS
jgi:hypothetical protein